MDLHVYDFLIFVLHLCFRHWTKERNHERLIQKRQAVQKQDQWICFSCIVFDFIVTFSINPVTYILIFISLFTQKESFNLCYYWFWFCLKLVQGCAFWCSFLPKHQFSSAYYSFRIWFQIWSESFLIIYSWCFQGTWKLPFFIAPTSPLSFPFHPYRTSSVLLELVQRLTFPFFSSLPVTCGGALLRG